MGPSSYVCWCTNHETTPINNSYIMVYHVISTINHRIQPLKCLAFLNAFARLGAPSCRYIINIPIHGFIMALKPWYPIINISSISHEWYNSSKIMRCTVELLYISSSNPKKATVKTLKVLICMLSASIHILGRVKPRFCSVLADFNSKIGFQMQQDFLGSRGDFTTKSWI